MPLRRLLRCGFVEPGEHAFIVALRTRHSDDLLGCRRELWGKCRLGLRGYERPEQTIELDAGSKADAGCVTRGQPCRGYSRSGIEARDIDRQTPKAMAGRDSTR